MKRLISLIALVGGCLFLLASCAPGNTRQIAPDFLAATLDGQTFGLKGHLRQQGNKVLIVAFVNTACKPCEEDLVYLQSIYDRYRSDGLDVVCVVTGQSGNTDRAKRFIRNLDLNLPVVSDKGGAISKRYHVTGFPCQYVIDQEGFVRFIGLGCSEGVKAKLEENLRELLSASFSPSFLNQENCRPGMESHSAEVNPLQQ
jgi:peroxiredoxin